MPKPHPVGYFLMASDIRRPVGRPAGTPLDARSCPHGHHECMGPGSVAAELERILSILSDLSDGHLGSDEAILRSIANRVLAFLGRHSCSDTSPVMARCPFGADCVSPANAAGELRRFWVAVLRCEHRIWQRSQGFGEHGEHAPTLIVSRIASMLGDETLAGLTLAALSAIHRDMRVEGDPFGSVIEALEHGIIPGP